ncbi:uncharacterized protein LOC141854650 [Brevipalpus obovatus]|uniref:uncharacterized protein LOC141854650 n=1 Tax=Brevipalpus obovatus TaxID=246614 RepID=UPI003D9EDC07
MDDDSYKRINHPYHPSEATRWADGLPSAPIIIPIMFFGVIVVTLLLILIKLLKRSYDKKYRSKYYYVDHPSFDDDKQNLKKSQEVNEADSPRLNSMTINNDLRTEATVSTTGAAGDDGSSSDNDTGGSTNLIQVDTGENPPSAPDESSISNQETLERRKKVKATESCV